MWSIRNAWLGIALVVTVVGAIAGAQVAEPRRLPATASESAPVGPSATGATTGSIAPRLREGTKLADILGSFKLTGDRVTFYTADGTRRYGGLENLNLERIARVVADSPDQLEWSVSGVVSEFRGTNYLYVTHAVMKSRVKGPAVGP